MNNKTKSKKNFLYSVLGQLVTIAVGVLLPRLYLVSYGSQVNGFLSSLQQLTAYLALFEAGIGTLSLQVLYGPVAGEDWGAINSVMAASKANYRRVALYYAVALGGSALLFPVLTREGIDYGLAALAVLFCGGGNLVVFSVHGKYNQLLIASGRQYVVTNFSTLTSILIGVSRILLVSMGCSFVFVLVASFCAQTLQSFLTVLYVKRTFPQMDLGVTPNLKAFEQRNFVLVHQVIWMIFQNTDLLILTVFTDLKVVSVYAVYKLVITQPERVLTIMTDSVTFILGQTFQTDREAFKKKIDLFESCYSAVAFAMLTVALYFLPGFIGIYTAGVSDTVYLDRWLPWLFVGASLLSVMRTPMMTTINFAGHFKQTVNRSVLEAVLNLGTSIAMVQLLGIYGVLLGTIVALLYRTNDIILYTNHVLLNRKARGTYLIYGLNFLVMAVTLGLFRLLFPTTVTNLLDFVLCAVPAAVLSLLLFLGAQAALMPHCRGSLHGVIGLVKQRFQKRG